jgi:imidazolonepropionase-like amidohydrolase
MDRAEALKLVTINPAKQLKIDKLTGSIEAGKDADLVLWSGDPLSVYTKAEKTFVDGTLYFDRASDLVNRTLLEAEKARLSAALNPKPKDAEKPKETPKATDLIKTENQSVQAQPRIAPSPEQITAIVGGTIHPVSGPVIADGVLLMRGGKILGIGKASELSVPAAARLVDAKNLHVWPGLFDANNSVGVNEIGSRRETQDIREQGIFQPELVLSHSVNPDSEAIKVARREGILTSAIFPEGGVISGMGAVINLDGWTWEELSIQQKIGLAVELPSSGIGGRFGVYTHLDDAEFESGQPRRFGAQAAAAPSPNDPLKPLNDFLADAKRYQSARTAEASGGPYVPKDPKFEAMLSVFAQKQPLFLRAQSKKEIEAAVAFGKKNGFRIVILGGSEADKCAALLVAENVPVVLGNGLRMPRKSDAPYDDGYTLPKRLADAGVLFCLSSDGESEKVRQLMHSAGMAAAFGLTPDEAIKTITLNPAKIFQLDNRLGTLDVGKDANLVLTTGDILELTSQVRAAFILGQPVELISKQSRLYDRWRARPKSAK